MSLAPLERPPRLVILVPLRLTCVNHGLVGRWWPVRAVVNNPGRSPCADAARGEVRPVQHRQRTRNIQLGQRRTPRAGECTLPQRGGAGPVRRLRIGHRHSPRFCWGDDTTTAAACVICLMALELSARVTHLQNWS